MKIYTEIGSKDRLFEMMQRVNKVMLSEGFGQQDTPNVLDVAFKKLLDKDLHIMHSDTQSGENESYVKLKCVDDDGNSITFDFKMSARQGDLDGVYSVDNTSLIEFTFDESSRGRSIKMGESELSEFNQQHNSELTDAVSEFADFNNEEPEIDEEYQDAVNTIDSYQFGDELNESEDNYPDPIGKVFKPKTDYPIKKKKRQLSVSIAENDGGEALEGGLGDDKSPSEFSVEQVTKGLGVEMEHTNNPMEAMEIVLDHLSEDSEYYTTKETPEASAQANAANDASAGDETNNNDTEMTNMLLGFKPMNVGDVVD